MKHCFIFLLFCCFSNRLTAQNTIPIDLTKASTTDVSIQAASKLAFTGCASFNAGSVVFSRDSGIPLTLDGQRIKGICSQGDVTITLDQFKLKLGSDEIKIPANAKRMSVQITGGGGGVGVAVVDGPAKQPVYEPSPYIATEVSNLYKFLQNGDVDGVQKILAKFNIDIAAIRRNELLKQIKINGKTLEDMLNAHALTTAERQMGVMDAQAFISASVFADAMATFIAKRFKEEINIAYLYKFREFLQEYEQYKELLPETYQLLKNQEPYNYTVFLKALREAFLKDFKAMHLNTLSFLEKFSPAELAAIKVKLEARKADTSLDEDLRKSIEAQIKLIDAISSRQDEIYLALAVLRTVEQSHSQNPVTALTRMDRLPTFLSMSVNSKERDGVAFAAALSRGLQIEENSFIDQTFLRKLKDDQFVKLYIAVWAEAEMKVLNGIKLAGSETLYTKITGNSGAGRLNVIVESLERIVSDFERIKKANNDITTEVSLSSTSVRMEAGIDILENILKVGVEFGFKDADKVTVYIPSAYLLAKLTGDITEGHYGLAANRLFELLNLSPVKICDEESLKKFLKYGMFAATVAGAQTSGEMVEALETAALPVGSYRIKRNNRFNISVNSYAGISTGYEHYNGNGGFYIAPTALVGLYLGSGTEQKEVKDSDGNANGLFLSLLDVGSIFAMRLGDDSTATFPEITWNNIFTPGLYYIHSFKKSPLSLGVGFQRAPQLRYKAATEPLTITDADAWRIGVKLTIDIPLFNIHTRANKTR